MTKDLVAFGFAAGNYTCKCVMCGTEFTGDKRACRCEPCAESLRALQPTEALTSNQYAFPMPPLDVAMNRAGQLRRYGAAADGEQKKLVVLADEIGRLRAALASIGEYDCPGGVHAKNCTGCAACDANEALSESSAHETSAQFISKAHARRILQDWIEDDAHAESLHHWPDLRAAYEALRAIAESSSMEPVCRHSWLELRPQEGPGVECEKCGEKRPEKASAPLDREAVNALALQCAQASAVVRNREWNFDRYRNGKLKAQGVTVHAATEAEAWEKARSLLHIDGNMPTDELRLQPLNGEAEHG